MIDPRTQESAENLQAISQIGRPIPGESLTNSPEQKYPWEGPTAHTDLPSAIDALLVELCRPEIFHQLVDSMRAGFPVGDMAEQILFEGFTKGQWNPDLMLLLVEPAMYILIALADMADVEPRIDSEEEPNDPEEQLSNIEKAIDMAKEKVVPAQIPAEIIEKVEQQTQALDLPNKSLLSKEEE